MNHFLLNESVCFTFFYTDHLGSLDVIRSDSCQDLNDSGPTDDLNYFVFVFKGHESR